MKTVQVFQAGYPADADPHGPTHWYCVGYGSTIEEAREDLTKEMQKYEAGGDAQWMREHARYTEQSYFRREE